MDSVPLRSSFPSYFIATPKEHCFYFKPIMQDENQLLANFKSISHGRGDEKIRKENREGKRIPKNKDFKKKTSWENFGPTF